jgi:hypothetical protein
MYAATMTGTPPRRAPQASASPLPLAYFVLAHASLAAALVILAARPDLPGGFFYHPRMIALVHLLTIGWISGSILGSFYIVAPLALVVPMPVTWRDWIAWMAFAGGAPGMAAHFWLGTYDGMAWSAGLVLGAVAWVGWRGWTGVSSAPVAPAVRGHIRLAFGNMLGAGLFGIAMGVDRAHGWLELSPIDAAYAHAHLASLGWAVMMIMGLGYRLIPMLLPSAMPSGRALWLSAALVEAGLLLLVAGVFGMRPLLPAAATLIVAGLLSFVTRIARSARARLPRPPSLPRRDWSVVQVAVAFVWLLVAVALGWWLSVRPATSSVALAWIYGTAGLLGFIAQMVAAMHGRLVPYYAWYRAMARRGGARPARSVHELTSPRFALAICMAWAAGVPCLAAGLATQQQSLIRLGALVLLAGVMAGAVHIARTVRRASV